MMTEDGDDGGWHFQMCWEQIILCGRWARSPSSLVSDLSRWLQLSQCIIYSLLFKKGYYCYHCHFWALFWLQLYLSVSMVLIYKSHSAFTLWLKGCCPLVLFVCTDVSSDYLLFVSNLCSYWHVACECELCAYMTVSTPLSVFSFNKHEH